MDDINEILKLDRLRQEIELSQYYSEFQKQSNLIEGIVETTNKEVSALYKFVHIKKVTVKSLVKLAQIFQPNAELRDKVGMNVRVGNHSPISGGTQVVTELKRILKDIDKTDSYTLHCEYEMLHPLTDGNGRTGRALWLWKKMREMSSQGLRPLPFLHSFYYQALDNYRKPQI